MGRKQAGLVGVITAALVFGLALEVGTGDSPTQPGGHHAIAEGKGPTSATVSTPQ